MNRPDRRPRVVLGVVIAVAILVALLASERITPSWSRTLSRELTRTQRTLNEVLSRHLRLGARGATYAGATVLGLAFLYGVVHAAGPGHGKVVVASLFLGREARPLLGIGTAFLISFCLKKKGTLAVTH